MAGGSNTLSELPSCLTKLNCGPTCPLSLDPCSAEKSNFAQSSCSECAKSQAARSILFRRSRFPRGVKREFESEA